MGAAASFCEPCELPCGWEDEEVSHPGAASGPAAPKARPQPRLALRIAAVTATPAESSSALHGPFANGDQVAVVALEPLKGAEVLHLRQEVRKAGLGAFPWPPRSGIAHAYYSAKVLVSNGRGGTEEHWCILQVAADPQHRTLAVAQEAMEDAKAVAEYADRFNHFMEQHAEEVGAHVCPRVRVCAPAGCVVLAGNTPEIVKGGETVMLVVYPSYHVAKFVFDGSQDYQELPHSFFHYVAWASGAREWAVDLQGAQEDLDLYLLDPLLLRSHPQSVTQLLSSVALNVAPQADPNQLSDIQFESLHPRCGPLCRSFDPQRQSATAGRRRHCGIGIPTCGLK